MTVSFLVQYLWPRSMSGFYVKNSSKTGQCRSVLVLFYFGGQGHGWIPVTYWACDWLFCFHSRWGFQKFWISHNKTISGDETKWTGWGARNYFSILYMLILKYGGAGIVETTNLVPSQPEALRDGFIWRSVTLATLDQISRCNRWQGRFSRITIEVSHLNQCSSIEFYSLLIK